jgi:ABC-type polar amino acid transport system ATPase subunit
MYLNKVTAKLIGLVFLNYYIFGHETLFDNHLYTYLKYTVFRGK